MANYLYNGVELPDINTVWTDKETYPYAYICDLGSSVRTLNLCKGKPTVRKDKYSPYKLVVDLTDYAIVYMRWGDYWEFNNSATMLIEVEDIGDYQWTSADIINTDDGTLYLAASKPIDPETGKEIDLFPAPAEPLDPTSMTMGWLVGRAVASQRK